MQLLPEVSVLLPVYNCEKYIKLAIDSILTQTFSNLELIIIDDNSTDETFAIISSIKDDRIIKFRNEKNSGPGSILSDATNKCRGQFIAIMHGDDIALPERIEKQLQFMSDNPTIDIVGTQFMEINDVGQLVNIKKSSLPLNTEVIKYSMLFNNCICHPSVMFRKHMIVHHDVNYNATTRLNEDYELWTKAILKGMKIANTPVTGIYYRRHEKQASVEKAAEELKFFKNLRNNYRVGFSEEINDLLKQVDELTFSNINNLAANIKKLHLENSVREIFFNKITFFIHGALQSGKAPTDFNVMDYFTYLRTAGWNNFKIQILYRLVLKLIQ